MINLFDPPLKRPSRSSSQKRNHWLLTNADAVLIVHASAKGVVEKSVREAAGQIEHLWVLEDPANAMIEFGQCLSEDAVVAEMKAMAG